MTGKVLFISHSAVRTGAPIILLHLLGWLKESSDLSFETLLKTGGPLQPQFEDLGPTRLYDPVPKKRTLSHRIWRRVGFGASEHEGSIRDLASRYRAAGIKLVYANTITNGHLLAGLASLDCPVICHVHELNSWIVRSGPQNLDLVKQRASHYLAASEAVKCNLTAQHGIPGEMIEVIHGFIPACQTSVPPSVTRRLRRSLGIPEGAMVVGGSGMEAWRKGKDLFIQLAVATANTYSEKPVHFVWVGSTGNDWETFQLEHDIVRAGLADRIHLIGHVPNPLSYFAILDAFAMVSREEPFGLVCLEAASLGKPILCFADAGGAPEFVEDDAGFVVPYLDIQAMADRLVTLFQDDGLRLGLGNAAAKKVRERHDVSVGAPKILRVIERFLN